MKPEVNNNINSEDKSAIYWKKMYEELETQMYNMMEMTVELIDKEVSKGVHQQSKNPVPRFDELHIPQNFEKEFRRLKLFEHRIKVTWLGKITLAYIALKKKIRILIKGK